MPARYDTIIVVRKKNARGEEIEYHTVGRRGPSIWRTGEPNPPGTPGYQAAYDAAIGLQAALAPPDDRATAGTRSTTCSTPTSAPASSAASPRAPGPTT